MANILVIHDTTEHACCYHCFLDKMVHGHGITLGEALSWLAFCTLSHLVQYLAVTSAVLQSVRSVTKKLCNEQQPAGLNTAQPQCGGKQDC